MTLLCDHTGNAKHINKIMAIANFFMRSPYGLANTVVVPELAMKTSSPAVFTYNSNPLVEVDCANVSDNAAYRAVVDVWLEESIPLIDDSVSASVPPA
jgi:hypothetical protein